MRASLFSLVVGSVTVLASPLVARAQLEGHRVQVVTSSAPSAADAARVLEVQQDGLDACTRSAQAIGASTEARVGLAIDARGRTAAQVLDAAASEPITRWRACVSRALSRVRFTPGAARTIEVRVGWITPPREPPLGAVTGSDAAEPARSSGLGARVSRENGPPTEPLGSLPRETIRRVIRAHIGEVRACYERTLARRPDARGRVVVSFIIAPDGAVQSAAVGEDDIGDAELGECITGAVRTWVFPAPDGGGVVGINYPFVLDSQQRGGARPPVEPPRED
ncbi:AgmX/PglI C-terminal domain-containing protein [Sandaracinus amylolyticus]|uniref:Putative abductin-like protein n=1 Tax=Sandaracinus amylolyticus TaxID=927083 RepID=A0A0F6SDI9_9BACT|nr:AgmX/PglI C-terminal domain-containing protein [Sandaracinus amylolyticus]AKF03524.1 Putative abductin-like protein [Sandaracinus amylolyticus]